MHPISERIRCNSKSPVYTLCPQVVPEEEEEEAAEPTATEEAEDEEAKDEAEAEGEGEGEGEEEAGDGMAVDEEADELAENGNMEQLAALVLTGEGHRLVGRHSSNPEFQAFIDNVPNYMVRLARARASALLFCGAGLRGVTWGYAAHQSCGKMIFVGIRK